MLELVPQYVVPGISEQALAAFNTRVKQQAAQIRSPVLTENKTLQALLTKTKLAPFFSFVIQSEDDLEITFQFVTTHPLTCSLYLVPELTKKILQIEELALPGDKQVLSKKLAEEILTLIRQFFIAYARLSCATEQTKQKFDWENFAAQAISALDSLIKFIELPISQLHLYGIKRIEQLNQSLNDYLIYAVNQTPMALHLNLVKPILEVLLLIDLFSFVPGEYEQLATEFYRRFHDLSDKASETTGDTKQQLALVNQIFDYLVATGRLNNNTIYADVGCGTGLRILWPSLNHLRSKHNIRPLTLAADLMPPPEDENWLPVAGNFSHPQFVQSIQQALEARGKTKQKIDIVTLSWSPINDLSKTEQLQAFRNFALIMNDGGFLILDVPAGYKEEIAKTKQINPSRPYGEILVKFFSGAGPLEKPFTINPIRDYILFGLEAGFRPVNLGKNEQITEELGWPNPYYRTQAGNDRAILIFEKVCTRNKPTLAEGILKEKADKTS